MRFMEYHPFSGKEAKRFITFVFVGGVSFCIHFFGYFLLSRLLFSGANRTLLNALAICFSVTFNFFAHRGWTYGSRGKGMAQIARYLTVIGGAGVLQSALFYIGFERLHLYDLFVTIAAAGISALFTFTAHGLFTFPHEKRMAGLEEQIKD